MTSISGLWPLLVLAQLATPPRPSPADRPAGGLPIRQLVEGRLIEVPQGTRQLPWRPDPLRALTVDVLEPPEAGDDMGGEEVTDPDADPILARFREFGLRRSASTSGSTAISRRKNGGSGFRRPLPPGSRPSGTGG